MTDTPFLILLWLIVGLLWARAVGAYEDQPSPNRAGSWVMILNCFMSFTVALVLLFKATFFP